MDGINLMEKSNEKIGVFYAVFDIRTLKLGFGFRDALIALEFSFQHPFAPSSVPLR